MANRRSTRTTHVMAAVAVLALLLGLVVPTPATAAPTPPGPRREQLRHLVQSALSAADGPATDGAPGRAGIAAANDAVSFIDPPADVTDPRADIAQVGVGAAGSGGLVFSVQVEQFTNPMTDPAWVLGDTVMAWGVDTDGDKRPEVVVEAFNDGFELVAEVVDIENGVYICDALPSVDAATKTLRASVPIAGCFGDVKRPAVVGVLVFDAGTSTATDVAPDSGSPVRFTAPPTGGLAEGGYAIVSRSAQFQRYGATPRYPCFGLCPPPPNPTATLAGTFEDYVGPGAVVGAASARPFDPGLWSVTDDGEVSTQDGAEWYGDLTENTLNKPVVGMAVLADRSGYWLVASDGGIFAYGDAQFYGSTGNVTLNKPIVGMAATPSGGGYWLVASDGGIFAYGDAQFFGSTGAITLNQPVVGMATGLHGQGYWLVARDGGIFAFGLPFYGSTGAITLQQPIVGMAGTRSGGGYRFIARDGGIFNFGDAEFRGSGSVPGRSDVVAIATA